MLRTTWYGSANRSCNDVNKMAAPIRTLQAVLLLCKLIEGIWNNYVNIEQKIMQIRFTISLCTWGYISLGDPTWQDDVWRKIQTVNIWPKLWKACKYYSFQQNMLLRAYFIDAKFKLMIWSARNNIILVFEPFWNLNRWIVLKSWFALQSIVLISFLHATFMKIGENDSAHEVRFKKIYIYWWSIKIKLTLKIWSKYMAVWSFWCHSSTGI